MSGRGTKGRTKQQRVPLDLFLSGMLAGFLGEKDHPVIVVDESKQHRRRFPRSHRQWSGRISANSSFCSSVTSCSFGTSSSQCPTAALCVSRWESMPKGGDTTLRAPARDRHLCLKRPSRTRTNDLTLAKKTVGKTNKPILLPKRNSFRNPIRRMQSMSSQKSKERVVVATKIHASI